MALVGTAAIWSFAYVGELGCVRLEDKLQWTKIIYIGTVSGPVFWFSFASRYSGFGLRGRLAQLALWFVPLLNLALLWSNASHGLMRRDLALQPIADFTVISKTYGPVFWVHLVYSYGLILAGLLLLIKGSRDRARFRRGQMLPVFVGIGVAWAINIAYVSAQRVWYTVDPTPASLMICGAVVAWGVYRLGLFDLVPAAREALIEQMNNGWIVTDHQSRIIDANRRACEMLNTTPAELIGRPFFRLLGLPAPSPAGGDRPVVQVNGVLAQGRETPLHYDLRSSPLRDHGGEQVGALWVMRDVSERIRVGAERERLIDELNMTLAEIQRLSGLLPICAVCKKIREDSGYWTEVEHYIVEHSEVAFAFAVCPDCQSRLDEQARSQDQPS